MEISIYSTINLSFVAPIYHFNDMSIVTKSVVKSDATSSHDSPLKIQFLLGLRDLTNDNDLI